MANKFKGQAEAAAAVLAAAKARAAAEADRSAAALKVKAEREAQDAEARVRFVENSNPAAARVAALVAANAAEFRALVADGPLTLPAGAVLDPVSSGWQSADVKVVRATIADAAIILRHRCGLTISAPGAKSEGVSEVRIGSKRERRAERGILEVDDAEA